MINKFTDVGDPCLRPTVAVTRAVPMTLCVTVYVAAIAITITAPPAAKDEEQLLTGELVVGSCEIN